MAQINRRRLLDTSLAVVILAGVSGYAYTQYRQVNQTLAVGSTTSMTVKSTQGSGVDADSALSTGQVSQLAEQLFGKVVEIKESEPVVEDIPETTLNLSLQAVFFSSDPSSAAASVALNSQPAKYYRVGDKIQNNVVVKGIKPTSITLLRNGELEVLSIARNKSDGVSSPQHYDTHSPSRFSAMGVNPREAEIRKKLQALRSRFNQRN
ncbi:hypothetical protein H0A36_01990 [Endozoicomonas sp. SM1973]|uniref:Type II secretion system protein GspC N-terminal domain-containing protein n=1 Tax=Spartinivicinus marinus TaxID=2994442 RepID=A0A853HWI7_9GAMM|nr:type II secretion system protein N [Spartinivicinus marinus]MCX4029997.1 hypothetical protein [Spartinivicinus marinus]NYZ64759.1 hypothetical protein [Spartinivicinus marinus]